MRTSGLVFGPVYPPGPPTGGYAGANETMLESPTATSLYSLWDAQPPPDDAGGRLCNIRWGGGANRKRKELEREKQLTKESVCLLLCVCCVCVCCVCVCCVCVCCVRVCCVRVCCVCGPTLTTAGPARGRWLPPAAWLCTLPPVCWL